MAVSRLRFVFKDAGTYYIDLARALSLQERRLHRQKMIYTVYGGQLASFTRADQDEIETVKINSIPMTWPMKLAINRGFRLWKKQRSVAMKNADLPSSVNAKYSDFKIHMNADHNGSSVETEADTNGYTILPASSHDGALYNANVPEWDYSDLVMSPLDDQATQGQDEDTFTLMAVGGTHNSSTSNGITTYSRVSLIRSWLDSRATPDVSGEPVLDTEFDSDPMNNLFSNSENQDEVLGLINTENDRTPYDEQDVFGSCQSTSDYDNLQRQCVVVSTRYNKIQPVAGFQALCGLLQIKIDEANSGAIQDGSEIELILDVETKGMKF